MQRFERRRTRENRVFVSSALKGEVSRFLSGIVEQRERRNYGTLGGRSTCPEDECATGRGREGERESVEEKENECYERVESE